jgi:DNA-binding MarR family transcriptional regulator
MTDLKILAGVRRGEWPDTSDYLKIVRELISDRDAHEALYDGLRSKIVHVLRAASSIEEVSDWRNALARTSSLLAVECKGNTADSMLLEIRLNVLGDMGADMVAQLHSFAPAALKDQPHFKKCLLLLSAAQGEMTRVDLIDALGLKQANGTRVLKILEAERLILRKKVGAAVRVTLTPEGRKALMKWESPPTMVGSTTKLTTAIIPGVETNWWSASAYDNANPDLARQLEAMN